MQRRAMQGRSAWFWVYVLCISGWVLPQASLGQTAAKATDAAQARKPALVYRGEPIVVPLECDYEDLLNAGMVCNEDSSCRLFLDLVAVGGTGQSVFALGNIHSSGGTVTSILLASDDEGATWREAAERMRGASLEQILFADSAHGWIAGQRWELTTEADPFLLITENGGGRWRKHELWAEDSDRSGVVAAFDFEDDEHGFLVIERLNSEGDPFELYETLNAGRSWSIRGITSDPPTIPIKRLIPRKPLWRLRADREHDAHTIERLVEGVWTPAAAFSSLVGACHSMDREEERPRAEGLDAEGWIERSRLKKAQ